MHLYSAKVTAFEACHDISHKFARCLQNCVLTKSEWDFRTIQFQFQFQFIPIRHSIFTELMLNYSKETLYCACYRIFSILIYLSEYLHFRFESKAKKKKLNCKRKITNWLQNTKVDVWNLFRKGFFNIHNCCHFQMRLFRCWSVQFSRFFSS